MNLVFEIDPLQIVPEKTNLVGEITEQGFMYFFVRDEDKMITGLSAFHFKQNSNNDLAEGLKKIFAEQKLLNKNYNKVSISYSMPQSILVPGEFYKPELNSDMLNSIHGDIGEGIIFTDKIGDKNIYTVYRIPSTVHHAVTSRFPLAQFSHQYSYLVKSLPESGNILQAIFYQEKFIAVLVKDGKLQILQTYNYNTAEDITYHLLNICSQFEVSDVKLELSGMIENDSTLFDEIHKYFLNVSFDDWSNEFAYTISVKEFPSHFFSHQFSIASCV